jgi:hypothetical protein
MKHVTQRRATEAALTNEYLTRQRVEAVERAIQKMPVHSWKNADTLVTWVAGQETRRVVIPSNRGFFGRLRWLFTGR